MLREISKGEARVEKYWEKMEATPSATPRHTNQLLPLLPSGPGGVHSLSLRRDRQSHHCRSHLRRRILAQFYWEIKR